jgi:isoamylase
VSAPGERRSDVRARGVVLSEHGADVAVYSSVATRVELCLFDDRGSEQRVDLAREGADLWHAKIDGLGPGQRYGYRVHGPYEPGAGLWCDPSKLLMDPYARAIDGPLTRGEPLGAHGVDSAPFVPRSIVASDEFDWGDDALPHRPWDETVVYEAHVRGSTMLHPAVPEPLRGTYLGIADDAFVAHLVALGVTALELMPVFEWLDEPALGDLGLTNYWGYNPIGFFAPSQRFATRTTSDTPARQIGEFKEMVKALHAADIEVLLDVVYNHTAEGGASADTLCWKGFDAPAYYRIDDDGSFVDTTGCGTSLNATSPAAVRLVLDSLHYWAEVCHVDGFRFDLAPTIARVDGVFDPDAPILERCRRDRILSERKLICEPWDVGKEDSAALGRFATPFREWNGEFRDNVRDYWRGDADALGKFATRLAGSTDLFGQLRGATASINFVTSHDGMTMHDLVSFDHKHNEGNGEFDRDGGTDDRSRNWGVEGETSDPAITARRGAVVRAMLATLFVARGVPMLLAGDELGRTQQGNNNAYCQDNEVSWIDWERADDELGAFVSSLVALRSASRDLLRDDAVAPSWLTPAGTPMDDWETGRAVAMWLEDPHLGALGVLVNGSDDEVCFELGERGEGMRVALSSSPAELLAGTAVLGAVAVAGWSVTVLQRGAAEPQRP